MTRVTSYISGAVVAVMLAAPLGAVAQQRIITPADKRIEELYAVANTIGREAAEKKVLAAGDKASVEFYYKLGELYKRFPDKEMLSVADPAKSAAAYEKAIKLSKERNINTEWTNRARVAMAELELSGDLGAPNATRAEALLKEAINVGYQEAMYRYGLMIERGETGEDANVKKAAYWYRAALQNQSSDAAFALERLYRAGVLVTPSSRQVNDVRALGKRILARSAASGRPLAALRLGRVYEEEARSQAELQVALDWYEKAIALGSPEAGILAARLYARMDNAKTPAIRKKSAQYMIDAANVGITRAAVEIAKALVQGDDYYLDVTDEVALQWAERLVAGGNETALGIIANWYIAAGQEDKAITYLEKSANEGKVSAMVQLYRLYNDSTRKFYDVEKAKYYIAKASKMANRASASQQVSLARVMLENTGLYYRPKQGMLLLQRQAQAGHLGAMEVLASVYQSGAAGEPNMQQAFAWFQRASLRGSTLSQLTLAQMYYEGKGVIANKDKAGRMMQEVLRKAGEDDATLLVSLGRAYKAGKGLPKDKEQALKWFMRASAQGHPGAKLEVARIIRWQAYDNYKPEDSIKLLEEAEKEQVADASLELGKMYMSGHHVKMNGARAMLKFINAHRRGSVEATRLAGMYLLSGLAGVRDERQGMSLLKEAASQGDGDAMLNIANHYQYGEKKDYRKYLTWLDKAAKADQPEAIYLIADMYMHGKNGYAKNTRKAVNLLKYAGGTFGVFFGAVSTKNHEY